MKDEFVNIEDFPKEEFQKIREDSIKILEILNSNKPRISGAVLVTVIASFLYKFENYKELLSGIVASVELSVKADDSEDS